MSVAAAAEATAVATDVAVAATAADHREFHGRETPISWSSRWLSPKRKKGRAARARLERNFLPDSRGGPRALQLDWGVKERQLRDRHGCVETKEGGRRASEWVGAWGTSLGERCGIFAVALCCRHNPGDAVSRDALDERMRRLSGASV